MNPLWLLVPLVCLLLPRAFGRFLPPPSERLPRDFDFDHYKARELNLRGLFDKTKW